MEHVYFPIETTPSSEILTLKDDRFFVEKTVIIAV